MNAAISATAPKMAPAATMDVGSTGSTANSKFDSTRPSATDAAPPTRQAHGHESHTLEEDTAQDRASVRAQRHAYAELTHPLTAAERTPGNVRISSVIPSPYSRGSRIPTLSSHTLQFHVFPVR